MEKIRAHIIVKGRVQGVFFRSHTSDKARELNLTGWVKNLPSGEVEAVFEGERENVEKMIKWCHSGPPQAYVTEVKVERQDYTGKFSGFEIRYGY